MTRLNPIHAFTFLLAGGILSLMIHTGCTESADVRGRTYDFMANLRQAEVLIQGTVIDPLRFFEVHQPWSEDDRIFCPAPRRTTYRFHKVPIGPKAQLHFGLGLHPTKDLPDERNEQGRVQYHVQFVAGGQRYDLFQETYKSFRLEKEGIMQIMVPLPDTGATHGDFLFHSDTSQGMSGYHTIWCGVELVSRGRPALPEEKTISFQHQTGLLFDQPGSPAQPDQGVAFHANFNESNMTFEKSPRGHLLLQKVPAENSFQISIPEASQLNFGLGIASRATPGKKRRDVCFQILVNGQQRYEQVITPLQGRTRRGQLDLEGLGGDPVTLTLRTSYTGKKADRLEEVEALWVNPAFAKKVRIPRQMADEGKNILLLVVDTLRADHLSCYGYERNTTPNLDRLAEEGLLFESVFAQSSWTIPSTATLLTGQYSYTHGLYDAFHWYLLPGISTLANIFQQTGFTTAAFMANHLISNNNNLSTGFENFHEAPWCTAAQLHRTFSNWLDDHQEERFFAYLHYMDPHAPYSAPGAHFDRFSPAEIGTDTREQQWSDIAMGELENGLMGKRVRNQDARNKLSPEQGEMLQELIDLYDAEIAYWDEQLGCLIAELKRRGLFENTLIVITSDHGDEFLEHGMFRHGQSLFNELLHVPMIFLNTDQPPDRRSEMAGLIDLAPTLINQVDPSLFENQEQKYLGVDLLGAPRTQRLLFVETSHGLRHDRHAMLNIRAVLTDSWKGIYTEDDGKMQLYHLLDDRSERNDLADVQPDLAEKLKELISSWVEESRSAAPYNLRLLDSSALESLKQMGYVK